MKQILLNIALVALMMNANADTFRLRMPTVADRIGANGKTIGETTLPAGAVLTGDVKRQPVPNEKLVASAMSPVMFKMMKPKDPVVFNAVVRCLDKYASTPGWAASDEFIFVEIQAYNQQWNGRSVFHGYLEKSSAAALKLIPIILDGAEHYMLLKIRYHDKDLNTNVDILDGKEIKRQFVF